MAHWIVSVAIYSAGLLYNWWGAFWAVEDTEAAEQWLMGIIWPVAAVIAVMAYVVGKLGMRVLLWHRRLVERREVQVHKRRERRLNDLQ